MSSVVHGFIYMRGSLETRGVDSGKPESRLPGDSPFNSYRARYFDTAFFSFIVYTYLVHDFLKQLCYKKNGDY